MLDIMQLEKLLTLYDAFELRKEDLRLKKNVPGIYTEILNAQEICAGLYEMIANLMEPLEASDIEKLSLKEKLLILKALEVRIEFFDEIIMLEGESKERLLAQERNLEVLKSIKAVIANDSKVVDVQNQIGENFDADSILKINMKKVG